LSPLLANALLNAMTLNEKRTNLAGLPPVPGGNVIESKGGGDAFMADDEKVVLSLFEDAGIDLSDLKILKSDEFDGSTTDASVIEAYLKDKFQLFLDDADLKILQMVNNQENTSAMAEALDMKSVDLGKRLVNLENNGYIKGVSGDGRAELTNDGAEAIATADTLRVLYTYELRPDAPDLKPGGKSRDFCATLIQLNRAYTRAEIELIGGQVGRDVWHYRGGWLHNIDTGTNQPSCRHYWKQNVILN